MSVVTAFIRLGRKYEIDVLYNEGLTRLTYECPPTFAAFNDMNDGSMITDGLTFEFINLARDLNLPALLPVAYYSWCCSGDVEIIMDGCEREKMALW